MHQQTSHSKENPQNHFQIHSVPHTSTRLSKTMTYSQKKKLNLNGIARVQTDIEVSHKR